MSNSPESDGTSDRSRLPSEDGFEHDGTWGTAEIPERDYKEIYEKYVAKGEGLKTSLDQAIDESINEVNPNKMPMGETAPNYHLIVQDNSESVEQNLEHFKKRYALRIVVEDPFLRENPDYEYPENDDEWIMAKDYRRWSIDNPNDPHKDFHDRPYVGFFSQGDKTLVLSRKYKAQDRAPTQAFASDILFNVIWQIGETTYSDETPVIQPCDLKYIIMNDVVNLETVAVLRQVFDYFNINLNHDSETGDSLTIEPGHIKPFQAIMGTPNVASVIRMLRDHHTTFNDKVVTSFTLTFRPTRFENEEYIRLLDPSDGKLVGKFYIGVHLGPNSP